MLLGLCAAVFAGNQRWFVDFLYEEEQMSCDSVILRNNRLIFPFFGESKVRGPLILVTGSYLFSRDVDPVLAAIYAPGERDGTVWLEAEYHRFTKASALDVFGARPTHTCFRTIPGLAFVDD